MSQPQRGEDSMDEDIQQSSHRISGFPRSLCPTGAQSLKILDFTYHFPTIHARVQEERL